MKTEELHKNFIEDFKSLLTQYHAEFEMEWTYDECEAIINFRSMFNENFTEELRGYSQLRLPNSISL